MTHLKLTTTSVAKGLADSGLSYTGRFKSSLVNLNVNQVCPFSLSPHLILHRSNKNGIAHELVLPISFVPAKNDWATATWNQNDRIANTGALRIAQPSPKEALSRHIKRMLADAIRLKASKLIHWSNLTVPGSSATKASQCMQQCLSPIFKPFAFFLIRLLFSNQTPNRDPARIRATTTMCLPRN